jgi:hypothetical protein
MPPEEQRDHDKKRDHADDNQPPFSFFGWGRRIMILIRILFALLHGAWSA